MHDDGSFSVGAAVSPHAVGHLQSVKRRLTLETPVNVVRMDVVHALVDDEVREIGHARSNTGVYQGVMLDP